MPPGLQGGTTIELLITNIRAVVWRLPAASLMKVKFLNFRVTFSTNNSSPILKGSELITSLHNPLRKELTAGH